MAKVNYQILALNRGLVSRLALARIDLKRMALSADTYENYIPRVMGSMMLRPGWEYVGSTRNDAASVHLPFLFSTNDTAIIELTDGIMRVRIDEEIVRRPAVTSKFDRWNGASWDASTDTAATFVDAPQTAYWKDNDQTGAVSEFRTGGYLALTGNGTNSARRDRRIAVVETNTEHSLLINIQRGNVTLRVGTSEGGDEVMGDRTLRPGQHSIGVTPGAAAMFVRLSNASEATALVDDVTLGQGAADMEIETPWLESDLQYVRYEQSGDVVFVACQDVTQTRIERQGSSSPRSWSVVDFAPEDGPFDVLNTGPNRLKVSGLSGEVTLTSEQPFFKSTNVGSLFRLTSAGQMVSENLLAENQWSDPIRITGIGEGRRFSIAITNSKWTAGTTVRLQRSPTEPGDWSDVAGQYWTANANTSYADALDNQIIYYRIGCKTGEFIAGDNITATLTFSAGSITGVCRAVGYTSPTVMSAVVLKDMGKIDTYTQDWYEGLWSSRRGFPSSVCLFDGRLFWAGHDRIVGSASDLYDSFDDTAEGDDRMIQKNIGAGPVEDINWLLPLLYLNIGTPGSTLVARASSFDEPLTQTRFTLRPVTNTGVAPCAPAKVDISGVFVSRSTSRVIELTYDGANYTYTPNDLSSIYPEIGLPGGFVRIGVQRFPDTRIHLVRGDGTACILLFDKTEGVACWTKHTTDGVVEDVVVLPGSAANPEEDRVYYVVKRTINGATKRYLERWAREDQAQGAADNRIADSLVVFSAPGGVATTNVTGLDHLEGKDVVVWQDGVCPADTDDEVKTYTVSGGAITLDTAAITAYVGLPYDARWRSSKLAVASEAGAPLTQRKIIDALGVVLADTHPKGLRYGQDFTNMDYMPEVEQGKVIDPDEIETDYDQPAFEFDGVWNSDARLCLKSSAPRPCTVLGLVLGVKAHDKI